MEDTGDNKESGCRGYPDQGPAAGETLTGADTEAVLIKGPPTEETSGKKESGYRRYTDHGAEGVEGRQRRERTQRLY